MRCDFQYYTSKLTPAECTIEDLSTVPCIQFSYISPERLGQEGWEGVKCPKIFGVLPKARDISDGTTIHTKFTTPGSSTSNNHHRQSCHHQRPRPLLAPRRGGRQLVPSLLSLTLFYPTPPKAHPDGHSKSNSKSAKRAKKHRQTNKPPSHALDPCYDCRPRGSCPNSTHRIVFYFFGPHGRTRRRRRGRSLPWRIVSWKWQWWRWKLRQAHRKRTFSLGFRCWRWFGAEGALRLWFDFCCCCTQVCLLACLLACQRSESAATVAFQSDSGGGSHFPFVVAFFFPVAPTFSRIVVARTPTLTSNASLSHLHSLVLSNMCLKHNFIASGGVSVAQTR